MVTVVPNSNLPPRTHKAGWRLPRVIKCVLGGNSVVEIKWDIPWSTKVCSGDSEEVWNDGLQGHDHTYGIEPEAIE